MRPPGRTLTMSPVGANPTNIDPFFATASPSGSSFCEASNAVTTRTRGPAAAAIEADEHARARTISETAARRIRGAPLWLALRGRVEPRAYRAGDSPSNRPRRLDGDARVGQRPRWLEP